MSDNKRVMIVDDDPSLLEVLDARLSAAGLDVLKASCGADALKILKKQNIDLLVTDMKMPNMSGMELFEQVCESHPYLPVIFLTAYGTVPDAVEAIKAGAVDYLTKPFEGRELVRRIKDLLQEFANGNHLEPLDQQVEEDFFWGSSSAMTDMRSLLQRVAATNANVLVLGESGVGKECIAKLIHTSSARADKPYVVVDCGSTPPGILESELFGHLKGSFTHAIQDKKGLIEAAHGGTLFLDEIGNISADMQSRLLRFLEEKKIRQVGAIKEKEVDCRVIAATNADLRGAVDEGNFRSDLYYRLKVVTLTIPPLRERREDIPQLARFFADNYSKVNNLPRVELPQKTLRWLQSLSWPGNVRELKNAIQSGVILCKNNKIQPEDLQLDSEVQNGVEHNEEDFSIEQSEKEAIIRALRQAKGVKKEAAELLGISRRAIQYKSKKYNLDASKFKN